MKRLLLLSSLFVFTLSACGPIIGQVMRGGEGASIEQVVAGDVTDLQAGGRLLVFGPFAKTREAFYICRGEEASAFAEHIADKGFFRTDLTIVPGFADTADAVSRLKAQSAVTIQKELGLESAPELILFGTILKRSMNVAPTRGVIQDVTYRLEFYNLKTRSSTIIDVKSKLSFKDCVPAVVDVLMEKTFTE